MSKIHNEVVANFTSVFEEALEAHGGKGVYGGFVGVGSKSPFEAAFEKIKAQIKKAYELEMSADREQMIRDREQRDKDKKAADAALLKAEKEEADYQEILNKRKKAAADAAREKALIEKFEKGK